MPAARVLEPKEVDMRCVDIEVLDAVQLGLQLLPKAELGCAAAERELVQIGLDLANRCVLEGHAQGSFQGLQLVADYQQVEQASWVVLRLLRQSHLLAWVRTHYVRVASPLAWLHRY